jgi:endoglucanase
MKRMISLLLTLTLAVSLFTNAAFAADSPKDGDTMVSLSFDGDKTEGFMIYTNGGSCDISNENESLCVTVTNPGLLDYSNQVYYDGFSLAQGCVYTYSFDISSDLERKAQYRIQLNGGDYHAYVEDNIDIGPDPVHIEKDWTMEDESDPAPRIVFNLGKFDGLDENTPEHHIYIDNITLVVKDASAAQAIESLPEYSQVALNQVGYRPSDWKTVFVKDETEEAVYTGFSVISEADGTEILSGTLTEPVYDKASWSHVRHGDFSDLKEPGSYHIEISGGSEPLISPTFEIADNVYDDLYKEVFLMLYRQRCGTETDPQITGTKFAHKACHTGLARVYGTDRTVDVSGGWHDAGDYGRYVVSGAKTVLDLLMAFEDFNEGSDDFGIPESGNAIPDLLDEARYEIEWMLKMQDPESGGVWHKVTCASFPGEVPPEEETDELILAPISITATADFAAVTAKASTIYKAYDPAFADTLYEAAKNAFAYIENTEDAGFKNPEDISTGEYPDSDTVDERLLAAVNLYLAGNEAVLDTLYAWYDEARESHKKDLLDPGLGWAKMNTYTVHDLATYAPGTLLDVTSDYLDRFFKDLDAMEERSVSDAYYMSLGKAYPWGSNMSVANNGMSWLMGNLFEGEKKDYIGFAKEQLDYLLGANALSTSYVTGFGTLSPLNPHHRPSQAAGAVMPGMLVGGPDSSLEDPYAKAVLSNSAPAMCYVDNTQSYSTNEVTVYWNSPLIYLLCGVVKSVES